MTPSILRRFAKYHGVNDMPLVADDGTGISDALAHLTPTIAPLPSLARLVQVLTRIEDAEMLSWSAAAKRSTIVAGALTIERDALLLRAGIDPERWAQVEE